MNPDHDPLTWLDTNLVLKHTVRKEGEEDRLSEALEEALDQYENPDSEHLVNLSSTIDTLIADWDEIVEGLGSDIATGSTKQIKDTCAKIRARAVALCIEADLSE